MEKNKIIIIVSILIIVILFLVGVYLCKEENQVEYQDLLTDTLSTNKEQKVEKEKIKVHISGEVKYNGILELEEGDRIDDAIKEAGGLTEQANISNVNLAYKLEDGQKIYIPNKNEEEKEEKQSGGIVEEEKQEKTNINKASQTELETLPGVGPSLALKIIEYREKNGKFKSIEEIKNVKGMGESKYEEIKELIKVK